MAVLKNDLNLIVLADILQIPTDWLLNDKILLRIVRVKKLLMITFVHDFIDINLISKSPYFVRNTGPYISVPDFTISDYYFDLPDDFDIDNIYYENDIMK